MCVFGAVEYQRQERSKTDATKMKLSKWPDSRVPRRTSLSRTFYYDRSQTAQWKRKETAKSDISPTRGGERTLAAAC